MGDEGLQEYDDDLTAVLEAVWGEGFMSPGGTEEVDEFLAGVDLSGKDVLDIGCGLGGIEIHLAKTTQLNHITGIDVDPDLISKSERLADKYQLDDRVSFQLVEPGPLPFADSSFDVVISKDSILHIPDKHSLAADIMRILRPGGVFAAADWLAGYEGEASVEMQAYLEAENLGFGMASRDRYRDALTQAGFLDVRLTDRNEWYRQVARGERDALSGSLFEQLEAAVGRDFIEHQVDLWSKMIVVLDSGELWPTHLYGAKPG